jgi:Zn-dependent membrane protease YugP
MIAQSMVQNAYRRYSREVLYCGFTGKMVAQELLQANGVSGVEIVMGSGQMSDHFDPVQRKLSLSPEVYSGISLAAAAIAAHETGHAIQQNEQYFPLTIRTLIAKPAQISSMAAFPLFFLGLLFSIPVLIDCGIYLYSAAVLFQVATLPVEFNASSRALAALEKQGIVSDEEYPKAKKVLSAAAFTYVASLAVAALQLFRLLALSGRRRR